MRARGTSRRRGLLPGVALVLAVGAVPEVRGDDPGPRARTLIEQSLSGIDFLPDVTTLEGLLSNTAELVALANSTDNTVSPGVRIRAFRSLGLFDDPVAHAGLTAAIQAFRDSDVPIEQLYLIAAIEALGEIAGLDDIATLAGSFSHDRRDVRAATARALGETGLVAACAPLEQQLAPPDIETDDQVESAIGDALVQLGRLCP